MNLQEEDDENILDYVEEEEEEDDDDDNSHEKIRSRERLMGREETTEEVFEWVGILSFLLLLLLLLLPFIARWSLIEK